jgi:sulfate adenylyltransferase subunit 1
MSDEPLVVGREYFFKVGTKQTIGSVEAIDYRVDVNSQEHQPAERLELNEIGRLTLRFNDPLALDPYRQSRATGSFVFIDRLTNLTVGAGMVVAPLADITAKASNYPEFELELNALIRKHFPHWGARDLRSL